MLSSVQPVSLSSPYSPRDVASPAASASASMAFVAAQSQSPSTPLSNDMSPNSASTLSRSARDGVVPASPSKSKPILGPDGQCYTPGEAAKVGLTIRTACEACRSRKLKCSGTPPEEGGCQRCKSDQIACIYSARAPIGRPKKRKAEGEDSPEAITPTDIAEGSNASAKSKGKQRLPIKRRSYVQNPSESPMPPPSKTEPLSPRPSTDLPTSLQRSHFAELLSAASVVHRQGPDSPHAGSLVSQKQPFFATAGPPVLGQVKHSRPRVKTSDSSDGLDRAALAGLDRSFSAFPNASHLATSPATVLTPANSTATSSSSPSLAFPSNTSTYPSTPAAAPLYPRDTPLPRPGPATESQGVPSLDDLSIAAFLQSLDTLEIAPSELMAQQAVMNRTSRARSVNSSNLQSGLQNQLWPAANADEGAAIDRTASLDPLQPTLQHGATGNRDGPTAEDLENTFNEWTSSSAILQDGLSFAVPADFSWWDLGLGPDVDSSSGMTTPAIETPRRESLVLSSAGVGGQEQRSVGTFDHASSGSDVIRWSPRDGNADWTAAARPRYPLNASWPRGAENGMGQGQIQTTGTVSATGLAWSSIPLNLQAVAAEPNNAQATVDSDGRMAPNTFSGVAGLSPSVVQPEQPEARSCRHSKANPGKDRSHPRGDQEIGLVQGGQEPRSCCSKKEGNVELSPTAEANRGIAADISPLNVATSPFSTGSSDHRSAIMLSSSPRSPPSKVHCVPNPSGKGCTCLCDMSVALLSVKRTLRETSSPARSSGLNIDKDRNGDSNARIKAEDERQPVAGTSADGAQKASMAARSANTTIQLTLSASQAIAAQCACSADCPTCRSDPSTEISASLLVSTALQIYARAVRTLREGFAAGGAGAAGVGAGMGGLDVQIGDYKPAPANARRIALFAMKLELKDLSSALGKISKMAQKSRQREGPKYGQRQGASDPSGATVGTLPDRLSERDASSSLHLPSSAAAGLDREWMNPIDQLVILKLHQQLGELLATVENLEAQSASQPTHGHHHHHHHHQSQSHGHVDSLKHGHPARTLPDRQ